jgi:hypothetical protein
VLHCISYGIRSSNILHLATSMYLKFQHFICSLITYIVALFILSEFYFDVNIMMICRHISVSFLCVFRFFPISTNDLKCLHQCRRHFIITKYRPTIYNSVSLIYTSTCLICLVLHSFNVKVSNP